MKKHIILVFFVLIFYKTFSQQTPQIVPPSPVTHEFEKYINYEVSMYNGLPDITIPLYSISLKGMEIPINLTYHASGIKYRQESGEVGVGWTLNPGYRVSRTVYGFPDEKSAKPSNAMDSISFYNPDPMKRDKYLTRFMDPDMPEVPVNYGIALTDRLDGEYDIFNYSLPVESGAFAISDRSTKAIQTFEKSNIALNYSTGLSNNGQLNGILGFDIRDTKGNRYLFGEHTVSDLNAIESTSKYGAFLGNAWGITDVITSYGDLLKFKYSAGNVGGWTTNNSSVTIFSANPSYVESTSAIDYSYGSSDAYKAFFVQEISSNKEKIQFARQSGYNLVSRLSVFDASNGLIKAVNFFYSNNGYHNFLDSIQITDKNLTAVQTYKFKYNFKDYSGSVMADQWGYYRPGDAQHRFHREFADDVIYQRDATGAGYNTATNFLADFGDRSAAGTDLFALNSITYPAGGSTEYIYGVHKSYDIHTQQYKTGGGLRIARIVSHDRAGSNTMIHDYTYGENESGFGTAQLNIDESLFVDEQVYLKKDVYATNLYPVRKLNYSTYQQGDVDPAGSLTSNVIYSEVTDHAISETPGNNGKIVYKYKLGRLFEAISFSAPVTNSSDYQNFVPRFVINYNYWNKPLLNEIKYYAYGVNQYSLKKAEHYAYRNSGTIVLAGLKVKPFATTDLGDPTSPKYYDFINSFFRYRDYSIFCDKNLLDEKREVLFSQTDSIVSKTTYQYNTLDQKMGETYYASDNIPVLSKISYPKEMISLNQDPSAIYQGMVAQNMLDVPIQLTKFKNSNQISFSQSNFYQPFTGMYVPDRVMIQQSVTDSLEVKLQYHNYDNRGNVLSFSENGGPKINYLYSYSKQYPVAEIRNTDYEIVEGVLGRANIENFSNLINPDKGAIDAFLSPLRLALPNAFVSTYVYEPSVGMASQTDYKGKTIYYEYDAFQRLDGIKDQDGNIVKKYSYHYDRSGKYYNLTTSRTLTRNNCALGLVSSPVTYTVSAGTYISSVSQQEATNLAENDLNLNAQNYANTYGICSTVYYNSVKSGNFNRNNCVGGQTGTAVTYTVPSNTYSSLLSQTDADAKAQHDIDTNGQAYANANGTCNSYNNVATSGIFFKNNCASGYEPGPSVTYTVPSNTYSSTLSQADADNQAQNDVNTNGQNYANTNGTCVLTQMITVSYSNNNLISGYYVKFHNNSSNQDYTFSISYGSGNFGTIPAGSYDVSVYNPNGSSEVYTFQVGSAEISGSEASFPGVTVGPGSVGVSIN